MLRKPIVTVAGHVDHGKTTLLDSIRNTTVTEAEAGKITQAIGASIIPVETIERLCGSLMGNVDLKIPGLLFIDTPGHAAFASLRERGGSLSDISIVVVDVNEGIKPQTEEVINILKNSKTPFVIVANKIDKIKGWKKQSDNLLKDINSQSRETQQQLDTKLYNLVGELYEKFQFNAERFDRVKDYTKQIAIVPASAYTNEGLPELVMVLVGLVQKYLEACLKCEVSGDASGTILEVKEHQGMGMALDAIISNGTLRSGDKIVIGGINEPIVTKVRGLFEPAPLSEIMDKKSQYCSVKEVNAATGVRICGPQLDQAVAGMPIQSCRNTPEEEAKNKVQERIKEVIIDTEEDGVIVKADTLGGVEAMVSLLKEKNIPIRRATIGNVTKKDIIDAESNYEKDPFKSVILGFNIKSESSTERAKVIISDVIYEVIEKYEKWVEEVKRKQEEEQLSKLTRPCKIMIMEGYVFRQSNPAVCGVSVEGGILKTGINLLKMDGNEGGYVKTIQEEKENLPYAEKGKEVACSIEGVVVGRQIKENETLLSSVPESHFRELKKFKHVLSKEEINLLKEIAQIKRKSDPMWGM